MTAAVVRFSACRGLPLIRRQLLSRRKNLSCSAVLSIDQSRSSSQTVSPWVLWILESPPVVFAEQTLTRFHEVSGLPWWASIVISTVGLRALVTFPLGVYSEVNLARLANLEPEAREINRILREEAVRAKNKFNLTEKKARFIYKANLKKQTTLLIERENCHPLKSSLLVLIQIPIWASISFALRDMAMAGTMGSFHYMSLTTEGLLWIKDLTRPDSTLIIPTMTALLHLTNSELFQLKRNLPGTKFAKIVQNFMRFSCFIVIPIGLILPSATSLYWSCSASTALAQNLILMSPKCRRLLRIPITAKEDPTPYATVWRNFQTRVLRRTT